MAAPKASRKQLNEKPKFEEHGFDLAHHPRRGVKDWAELMLKDHGFLRLFWHNRHQISDRMWRANQPAPSDVKKAAQLGVKTIINLRGPRSDGGWRLEKEACDKHGITLVDFTIRSRDVPSVEMIKQAQAIFEEVEKPALMHCKSGADRAGIMSALYLLMQKNASVDEAMQMLSFKYLHVKQAKTGLLDAFIENYHMAEKRGVDFMTWVETEYDPQSIKSNFMSKGWANRLIDGILRRE